MGDQKYVQLYGGLLARNESEEPAGTTDPLASKPRRTRKRKPSNEGDAVRIGKRGRPRVDPKDQSAIERRRTQIRLAQRAYRERKETTISVLEQRVAQLKEIINEMNQTFLDYNSKAINSGVITWNSAIGHDLKEATQRFLHLAKKADLEIGSDDREQSATSEQPLDYESQFNQPMTPVHDPHFSTIEQASMVPSGPVGMLGYEVTYEPEPFPETHGTDENIIDSENVNDRDLTNDPENMNNVRNIGSQDYYQGFGQDPQWDVNLYQNRAEIPSPSSLARNFQPNPANDNLLTPTYTYSFQETTFARRLLRSSYETAFRLLNDPCTPRSEIHRRLRFTFCHANVDTIIARLRSILSRSNKDNLENWDFPILHAGDAGFHYPRGPLDNGAPLPQKWGERRSIGPWKQGQALNREAEAAGPESFACMAKCEGTWFDPNDVEEYYKTKGLFLDGISSVAELEVDVPMSSTLSREMTAMGSPTSTSTESVTEPRSSPESLVYDTGNAFHTKTNAFVDTNNDDDISNLFTSVRSEHGAFDFSCEAFKEIEKTAEYLPLQQPQYYSSYTPTVGKRRIIIDVDRLLETLNRHSVCIGRAPGYRKENVDFAFTTAVEEAL